MAQLDIHEVVTTNQPKYSKTEIRNIEPMDMFP